MSEDTPQNPDPEQGQPASGSMPTESGRATSVRFRADADVREQARAAMRMDAANESFADALRITFRLLQFGMFVLVLLFLGSGIKVIQEGERGLKVRLGEIKDANLEKGLHWALPYPVGEIVPIGAGSLELRLETNKEFFPYVSNEAWNQAESKLSQSSSIDPAEDGSLITADLNLAHTQWTVNYRRTNHERYAMNVLPQQERQLVRVAAMRGVVHAVSRTTIDDLLKDRDTVAADARKVAQRALDEMASGITIEQMTLNRKFAPATLIESFATVYDAAQAAGQQREEARSGAQNQFNGVAGLAAQTLIDLIDTYERAVEVADQPESVRILAKIDTLLDGGQIQIDGQPVGVVVSGEVSQILADAHNDAFQIVSDARGELELFLAKQERYDANPRLMVMREWANGMSAFYGRSFVQSFMVRKGQGDAVQIRINEDPDIRKMLEESQRLSEAISTDETREEARARARIEHDQGN